MGNAPSSVPLGAQVSAVNASLQCQYLGQNVANFIYASTTAPLVGRTGQQLYFSDVIAHFYLKTPASNVDLELAFSVTNASPSLYTVKSVSTGTDISFQTAPLSVGPFTLGPGAGDASTIADLGIRYVRGTIDGNSIVCGQDFDYIVASVPVYGTGSGTLSMSRGVAGPSILGNTRYSAANLPLYINTDSLAGLGGKYTYAYQVEGSGPTYVRQGQQFNWTDYRSLITAPGNLVQDITSKYGKDTYLVALQTEMLAVWPRDTTRPQDYDINRDADGGAFPLRTGRYTDGPSSAAIVFPLPNWDSLTLPLQAAQKGVVGYYFPGMSFTITGTSVTKGDAGTTNVLALPGGQHKLLSAPIINGSTVVLSA